MGYDYSRELDLLDTLQAVDAHLPAAALVMGSVEQGRRVVMALHVGGLVSLHDETGAILAGDAARQALWNDGNWEPGSTAVRLRGTAELDTMMNSVDRTPRLARVLKGGS